MKHFPYDIHRCTGDDCPEKAECDCWLHRDDTEPNEQNLFDWKPELANLCRVARDLEGA